MAKPGLRWYHWLLIALGIVLVIVLFTLSLGSLNGRQFSSKYNELKESLEKAKLRNIKLRALVARKTELKKKLAKRFKLIYFTVRVILVLVWLGSLYGLYHLGLIQDQWDALNYSELMLIVLVLFNFITFGTLSNLDKFLEAIRTRVENWVYGKYVNIDEHIESDQKRLFEAQKAVKKIKEEMAKEEVTKKIEQNSDEDHNANN